VKPTDALNSIFIGITTLHVLGNLSAHHQEFLAVHQHWYIFADMMTVCYQEQVRTPIFWYSICLHHQELMRCLTQTGQFIYL